MEKIENEKSEKNDWQWQSNLEQWFTQDGKQQQSISEKEYDKSLQTKYKMLKVSYQKIYV